MLSRAALRASSTSLAGLKRGFATSTVMRADEPTPQSGHTAKSSGFSKREKAQEDGYIIEREREKYRLAQQKLEQQKKDLDKLEADHKQGEK